MNEEKNTDRAFRDKLDGYQVEPPAHLWDGILGQLAAQQRKKRIARYSWASVAALIVFAFIAGWYINDSSEEETQQMSRNAGNESAVIDEQPDIQPEAMEKPSGAGLNKMNRPEVRLAKTTDLESDVHEAAVSEKDESSSQSSRSLLSAARNLGIRKIKSIKASLVDGSERSVQLRKKESENRETGFSEADRKLIAQNGSFRTEEAESEAAWKMGLQVSTGYSSNASSHSENYSRNMTWASNEGNGNVGGGLSVQYKTGKRWSVESGVYYAKNGQKSHNSLELLARGNDAQYDLAAPQKSYLNTAVSLSGGQMAMNSNAGIIEFNEVPKGAEIIATPETSAGFSNALLNRGEFSQVFDFVEIPLYLRYLLVEGKIDVEVLGGVNAGLVVGNSAYMENEYGLQRVGKTKDISPLNMSGTIGVGLNYALGRHLSLAVEPRVNYHLSSINQNPEVHYRPYRIGVYTGFYYEF